MSNNDKNDDGVFVLTLIGAGLFYKYVTDKLLKGAGVPPELKGEFDVLIGQLQQFEPKILEDVELKEMNETIRVHAEAEEPLAIVAYAAKRIEKDRVLLEGLEKMDQTTIRIRSMADGLPQPKKKEIFDTLDALSAVDSRLKELLGKQISILEVVRDAYQWLAKSGGHEVPETTKPRLKELGREYEQIVLKLGSDSEKFNATMNPSSGTRKASIVKMLVAAVAVLGAIIITVLRETIRIGGKINEKK